MTDFKFDQSFIDDTVSRSDKIKEQISYKRLEVPGVYVATIEHVDITNSRDGSKMIVIKHRVDKELDTIDSFYSMGNEINVRMLVEYVWNAFGKKLKPMETSGDLGDWLFKQVKSIAGKKIKCAVRIHESLYTKDTGEVIITKKPKVWYVGKENDSLSMDESKGLVPLSDKDKAALSQKANQSAKTQDPGFGDPWDNA